MNDSKTPFTSRAIGSIVIVGGGTAGWMAASLFAHHFAHHWPETNIQLIESEKIPPIGVGEGSTPYLKDFFNTLGITEQEWMPECFATFKCGIRFPSWNSPNDRGYFHPFYSPFDKQYGERFFELADTSRHGHSVAVSPNNFFLSHTLAEKKLCPKQVSKAGFQAEFEMDYGYHFDSSALGQFLRRWAESKGVCRLVGTVVDAVVRDDGRLSSLVLEDGRFIAGDFFVDCSGFNALLIEKKLGSQFKSYGHSLLNDSAVAVATERNIHDHIASETLSTGLSSGWAWQIPLVNRFGNGYVYSSQFQSAQSAESELCRFLGVDGQNIYARHLSMRVGRLEQHWKGNCLAVGLSQGFLEPLEATALMLIQFTLEKFIQYQQRANLDFTGQVAGFNREINGLFDGVKDYIQCHYKLNKRSDTQYWVANRESIPISPELDSLLSEWQKGGDIRMLIEEREPPSVYPFPSWYCILAGMGCLPSTVGGAALEASKAAKLHYCDMAQKFCGHRTYLMNLYGAKWPKIDRETTRSATSGS